MTKAKLDNKKGDADFNNVEDISGIEDSNTVVSVPKNDDLDRSLKLAQLKTTELTNKKLEVEIKRSQLQLITELSDLGVKGILAIDDVKIEINDVLYLLKEK